MPKILIVDDEPYIRDLYSCELIDDAYDVITAADGHKLAERIEKEKPDLVILDIKMPGYNGLDLLQMIRNKFYNMPVILCTAYEHFRHELQCLAADYFIVKSFDLTQLKGKVKAALEAGTGIKEDIVRTLQFNRDDFEAGMILLNYLERNLGEKLPYLNINKQIMGFSVRIVIESPQRGKEKVEPILENYGMILQGRVPLDQSLFDPKMTENILEETEKLFNNQIGEKDDQREKGKGKWERIKSYVGERLQADIGTILSVNIIGASGILTNVPSTIRMAVTNNDLVRIDKVDIEILPSGDFYIKSKNPVSLDYIEPKKSKEAEFVIQSRLTGETTLNIKVNNVLMKPAPRIHIIQDNPYVYGSPISNPSAFFGRKSELNEIYQAVIKPAKQDILLLGERRSGKTSLLYQLDRKISLPFIPVYLVLNVVPPNPVDIISMIVQGVVMELIANRVLESDPWINYKPANKELTKSLKEVFKAAVHKLPEMRVVLLVDEGDYLLEVENHLQNILRATLQSKDLGSRIRAVFAGTNELRTFAASRSSPFFNQFRNVKLKLLSKSETLDLINSPAKSLGYSYDQEAMNHIYLACRGHPYYCQRVCYEAFNLASKQNQNIIDKTISEQAIRIILESNSSDAFGGFKTYFWDAANSVERDFMTQLVTTQPAKFRSKKAPDRLIDWQVITKKKDSFDFTALLFREWVKRLARRSD